MSKKRVVWVIVLLVAVAVAGVLLWFFSPGVHALGPFLRMDTTVEVYLFEDGYDDVYTGETAVFTADFTVMERWEDVIYGENWAFQGSMAVQGYEIEYDAQWTDGPGGMGGCNDNGCWSVSYDASWVAETSDGDVEIHRAPYRYRVRFYVDDPETMVIYIFGEGQPTLMAVPAASLEEAAEKLESFLQRYRENLEHGT